MIDTFFDSLLWSDVTEAGPTVNLATYGNLMEMVDNENRWVYSGSVTTPPCAKSVYWNVLSTIYPVKKEHLDLFKAQLARGEDGKLVDYGNWRLISEEDEHGVIYLETNTADAKELSSDEKKGLVAGVIILAVTTVFGLVASICLWTKVNALSSEKKGGADVEMASPAAAADPAPEALKQME